MRTRHWLAAITGGCMALAGVGTAEAQQGPPPTSNGNPDQVGMGMMPAPYNLTYGPMQPNGPGYQPGYPPGGNPWPGVSPYFGPQYDQTAYEGGLWYQRMLQPGRRYYATTEALFGKASKPSTALIGAPDVNPLSLEAQLGLVSVGVTGTTTGTTTGGTSTSSTGTSVGFSTTQFNQNPGSGPIISASSSNSTTGTGTTGTSTGSGTTGGTGTGTTSGSGTSSGNGSGTGSTGAINIFPVQDTGILPDNLFQAGFRGTWGWDNPDGSGFVASGFALNKATSAFQLSDPLLNLNINDYRNFNPFHLHAWFGLSLAGADTDGTTLARFQGLGTTNIGNPVNDGAVIPFDMGVTVAFTSSLAGGNLDWYFANVYERDKIKIRPTAGAKYVRLQEGFVFDGFNSGMGYTVSVGSSTTGGTGGTTGGSTTGGTGTSGGGGTAINSYLSPSTFQAGFNLPNVSHSHLQSGTLSDMGGPEIGFRIDMGGSKFQLWTQTKAGALANVSQRQITGFGIGNAFNIITPNTVPVMPNDPTLTSFATSQTTTTFTPMFEQQINCKLPIFNLVPYLNKLEAFERAYLTGGYTFLFLGDVYRPNNAIIWNQYPNIPQLNGHKSNYYNSMFNLGVEWTF